MRTARLGRKPIANESDKLAKSSDTCNVDLGGIRMVTTGSAARADASRKAILSAFNALFPTMAYAKLSVGEIVRRAGVSRSTFYQHFKSKDTVLKMSLTPVINPFASTCDEKGFDEKKLMAILEHFRENWRRALGLINGPGGLQMISAFTHSIGERLSERSRGSSKLPLILVAAQIAESQLGLVRVWLTCGALEQVTEVATAVLVGTQALVNALV